MAAAAVDTATRATDAATADAAARARSASPPPPRAVGGAPVVRLAGETRASGGAVASDVARLVRAPGAGQPLPAPTRAALESSFGVSLAPVRVHADTGTRRAVDALDARALTHGRDVFLGSRERTSDLGLMGHEVAHVVQQQASPVPQRAGLSPGGDGLEREAQSAGQAAARGEAVAVQGRTGGAQPQGLFEGIAEWAEEKAWSLLNEYAPELVPIIREGPIAWIADKVAAAVEAVFDTVMAPVRAVSGVVEGLSEHFANLLTWMREAAERIARGDCGAITEAVDKIQKVIDGLASRVFDRLQQFFDKAKAVFNTFKERFAAPAWDFIKRFAGRAWDRIKELATWIWDKTAPIRRILERAWTWLKNKLGIGEGPEGQDGILQWIQRKAEAIWEERIKPFVERFKKPLLVIAGILVLFSPAGPILVVVAGAIGLVKGIQWIRQRLATKDGVVEGRGELQGTIIPGIINAIRGVTAKLTGAVAGILEKLGGIMSGFGELVAAVGGSIFKLALSLIQWLADQFKGFVTWASDKLSKLAEWFGNGLNRLIAFLQPVLDVLKQIGDVVLDVLKLPGLVLGALWKKIPACIRDPFVNFLINHILKRIPIFKQLTEVLPAIWSRLKATVMTVIQKVFKEGDLAGAALVVFKLILDALAIPLELVTSIFTKAGAALDLILKDPVGFLMNLLRTLAQGFVQFGKNALRHLATGFKDWLFGAVTQAGISPPQDFSIRAILGFVLDVLGVTVDRVLERLEGRIGKDKVAPIRKALNILAKVWDWVSTLLNEGPQGVWNRIKEKAGDLWQGLLDGVVDWMITTITKKALAKLATMLDPSGIMAVVNSLIAVYKAIQSFVRYLKQILGIVHVVLDTVTDITKGAIAGAANLLEMAMARAIPIILGFLANQVGLGDLGERIREIIKVIQDKVNSGIDWVIDKAIKAGAALLNALGLKAAPAAAAPGALSGDFIYEAQESGGHTIKIRRDLKVFRFSDPVEVTGANAQKIEQAALEKIVKPEAVMFGLAGDRASGSVGHVKGVKEEEGRDSLTGADLKGYQPGDHRGHLIGDRFYGSGQKDNIVPMHAQLNLSTFKIYENKLASRYRFFRDTKNTGVLLHMQIVPRYPGNDTSNYADYRPTKIEAKSKIITLKEGASKLEVNEEPIDGSFSNPPAVISDFSINDANLETMKALGLEDRVINAIIRHRKFANLDDLQLRLAMAVGEPHLSKLERLWALVAKIRF